MLFGLRLDLNERSIIVEVYYLVFVQLLLIFVYLSLQFELLFNLPFFFRPNLINLFIFFFLILSLQFMQLCFNSFLALISWTSSTLWLYIRSLNSWLPLGCASVATYAFSFRYSAYCFIMVARDPHLFNLNVIDDWHQSILPNSYWLIFLFEDSSR